MTIDCNPITEKDLFDDKVGILDIKAKLNNTISCNIEMQVVEKADIEKRILFYWSKMYSSNIKAGEHYDELKKSIVILFTDFEIKNLSKIKNYITKWNLREENYPEIVLTDMVEIYIIETKKAINNYSKKYKLLNSWVQFINNPEEMGNMEVKEIEQAKEVLKEISADERERRLTELRQKYIMDQNAVHKHGYEQGIEAGIEQGLQQGIEQGIEQGRKLNNIEIVKKMKEQNIPIQTIIAITGLTKEEIDKIN